jgi:hypothetical protein
VGDDTSLENHIVVVPEERARVEDTKAKRRIGKEKSVAGRTQKRTDDVVGGGRRWEKSGRCDAGNDGEKESLLVPFRCEKPTCPSQENTGGPVKLPETDLHLWKWVDKTWAVDRLERSHGTAAAELKEEAAQRLDEAVGTGAGEKKTEGLADNYVQILFNKNK